MRLQARKAPLHFLGDDEVLLLFAPPGSAKSTWLSISKMTKPIDAFCRTAHDLDNFFRTTSRSRSGSVSPCFAVSTTASAIIKAMGSSLFVRRRVASTPSKPCTISLISSGWKECWSWSSSALMGITYPNALGGRMLPTQHGHRVIGTAGSRHTERMRIQFQESVLFSSLNRLG